MSTVDLRSFTEAVKQAAPTAVLGTEGWFSFSFPGGALDLCLRPGGVLFCPTHQETARWCIKPGTNTLALAWGKFGCYEFEVASQSPLQFAGSTVGKPEDWRKMEFRGPFSAAENRLLGAGGGGSEWKFAHPAGEFLVQFRGDGFNHFVCESFPAHSHWTLAGANRDELTINWSQYGIYEMRVDGAAGAGAGSLQGTPADWRKMQYVRDLQGGPACGSCGDTSCVAENCKFH